MTDIVHGHVEPGQADIAYQCEQRIQQHVRNIRTTWIKLAEDLFQFHEDSMWADLGYTGFEAWLAGPEIELERRWVYDLISMWRELVVTRGVRPEQLAPVAVSKVREVLPAIRRGDVTVTEGLSDAETLGRRDLEEKYRRRTAGSPEPVLEASAEQEWAICHACGSRYPVARPA